MNFGDSCYLVDRRFIIIIFEEFIRQRGQTSVRLIRNYPDRQARGICVLCQALIYPKSWFVLAPDAEHPRGKPVLMGPHKDYAIVQQIIAYEGS